MRISAPGREDRQDWLDRVVVLTFLGLRNHDCRTDFTLSCGVGSACSKYVASADSASSVPCAFGSCLAQLQGLEMEGIKLVENVKKLIPFFQPYNCVMVFGRPWYGNCTLDISPVWVQFHQQFYFCKAKSLGQYLIQLTCYIVVSYLYSLKLFVKWDMQSSLLDMSNFLDNLDFYLGQILFLYSSKIGTIFDPKILLDIGAKFDLIKKTKIWYQIGWVEDNSLWSQLD